MFRYAIFDFDGTLADTGAGVFASVQYALRSMGEPELDSETLKYFIGPPLETSFFVKCGLDSERCHEAVEKYREYYSTKGIYELEFFPSTLQTLRELKAAGVKTAVGSSKPELFEKYSAGAVLPRGIFGNFDEIVERLIKSGARYALCNTLDSVAAAKKAGVQIIGGPFLNIFNSVSLSEIQKLGAAECVLSYEMTLKQLTALEGECRRGVCVYGRVPLMLTRNCPVKNGKSCRECGGKSFLRDRKGIEFPVRCTNGFSELFNSRPIYMADRMSEVKNADFVLLEFTTEDKEQISSVLKAYQKGSSPEIEFTRGLLYRGVE